MEGEVIECHIIRFCRPMMQKTAYELWLKDQKTEMHLKCARFLEENAHRCDHCRSRDFIPYHHFTMDIRLNTLDMDTVKKMTKCHKLQSKLTSFLVNPNYFWEVWSLRSRRRGSGPWGFKSPEGMGTKNDEISAT
jgi:adenylate cyclase 10